MGKSVSGSLAAGPLAVFSNLKMNFLIPRSSKSLVNMIFVYIWLGWERRDKLYL